MTTLTDNWNLLHQVVTFGSSFGNTFYFKKNFSGCSTFFNIILLAIVIFFLALVSVITSLVWVVQPDVEYQSFQVSNFKLSATEPNLYIVGTVC
jgi:hypothetical protein